MFLFTSGARSALILGDSGYAWKKYLMVPYLAPWNRAEEKFNNALCRTWVTIEQNLVFLKGDFLVYSLVCILIIVSLISYSVVYFQKHQASTLRVQ